MAMRAIRRHWTLDDVDRLVDRRAGLSPRYELVDGDLLVTPAPSDRHQRIVAELFVLLHAYVAKHALGEVRLGPAAARVSPQTRFEPDIFVVPNVNGRRPRADDSVTRVSLIVEVLSPESAHGDRVAKRRHFQAHDVPEYWVVDGDSETFEVWRGRDERAELIDTRLAWQPLPHVAAFELDVRRFFDDMADEV